MVGLQTPGLPEVDKREHMRSHEPFTGCTIRKLLDTIEKRFSHRASNRAIDSDQPKQGDRCAVLLLVEVPCRSEMFTSRPKSATSSGGRSTMPMCGNRHCSTHCHYVLFAHVPSELTGTISGNPHWKRTAATVITRVRFCFFLFPRCVVVFHGCRRAVSPLKGAGR